MLTLRWILLGAVLWCGVAVLSCVGGGGGTAPGQDNDQLAQLAALPAPADVGQETWAALKDELAQVLAAQQSFKRTSAAPLDAHSKVDNLAASDGAGEAALFTFSYRNTGDYDQNGTVGLTDLVPLGMHFGKNTSSPDWQAAQVADGTFDGMINIADVTPIGQHWQTKVEGYELQVSATLEPAHWSLAAEIPLSIAAVPGGGGFKRFSFELATPAVGSYYRVVPFEGAGAARSRGIPSDAVQYIKGANIAPVILAHPYVEPVLTVAVSDAENDDVTVSVTVPTGLTPDATTIVLPGGNGDVHFTWSGAPGAAGVTTITASDGVLNVTDTQAISISGGIPEPTNLYATDGDYIDKVRLTWDKAGGAAGYKIYRDDQGTPVDIVGDVAAYDDISVADSSMHTYWVKATDGMSDSFFSEPNEGYKGGAFRDNYVVLGWNDLGMHCMNQDFSTLMILPPYNTLHAQIIQRGIEPQIITEGLTVSYEIPGNTTSVTKTNFWDYADDLLGVSLPPDEGLTGHTMSGQMTPLVAAGRNDWNVTGIPLTQLNDAMQTNSYALSRISVFESSVLVAQTQAVVPVSWEISCNLCHASDAAILGAHDNLHSTNLAGATPVLCGTCHAQPELGLAGMVGVPTLSSAMHTAHAPRMGMAGLEVDCYACHPGQVTKCLRDVHFSMGFTCHTCHGDMLAVGDASRQPWADEPRCDGCHSVGGHEYEQPGVLYRDSMGHNGVHCAACHGSPHAIQETVVPADNVQALALQGHAGMIDTCEVCHTSTPGDPFNHTLGEGGGD